MISPLSASIAKCSIRLPRRDRFRFARPVSRPSADRLTTVCVTGSSLIARMGDNHAAAYSFSRSETDSPLPAPKRKLFPPRAFKSVIAIVCAAAKSCHSFNVAKGPDRSGAGRSLPQERMTQMEPERPGGSGIRNSDSGYLARSHRFADGPSRRRIRLFHLPFLALLPALCYLVSRATRPRGSSIHRDQARI